MCSQNFLASKSSVKKMRSWWHAMGVLCRMGHYTPSSQAAPFYNLKIDGTSGPDDSLSVFLAKRSYLSLTWISFASRMDSDRERERTVFVTVGTTSFDSLVKAVDSTQCKEALVSKGFTNLLIQLGRGTYFPTKSSGEGGGLKVEYFTFSPNIAGLLQSAALVIGHAGSGSIFETLRMNQPLIVLVNEALMDNHQSELAEELAERKFLYCAHPETLAKTIECMDLESLHPYPPSNPMAVVQSLNQFLGFLDD